MNVRSVRNAIGAIGLVVALVGGYLAFHSHQPWLAGLTGLGTTLFLGYATGPVTTRAGQGWGSYLTGQQGEKLESYFKNPTNKPGPFLLGVAETLLFYGSLATGTYEVIVGWLVFKTAAKWSAWQHVMQIPSEIPGIDAVEYLGFRLALSSRLTTRFLVGTLINVLAGAAGAFVLRFLL